MPDRTSSARGAPRGARSLSVAVDVVLFTPRGSELAVLVLPSVAIAGGLVVALAIRTVGRDMARVGVPA